MSQYRNILVDIPDDKGVHKKSAGKKGEKYVYKYVDYFRNAEGKPRNKARALGKYDSLSGKMHPNDTYFEMYKLDPSMLDISIWNYGYSYLVLKAFHDTGMLDCLAQAFGARAMDIVAMAAYIIREGNAMDGIDDWQQRHYFPEYTRILTSQATSKVFASISDDQRSDFFKLWVKKALGNGSVCYDVTSISSYSQEMTTIERGYNRDGDNLSQFNMGFFCNETTKIPLYYNRYNGSLTDRTNLSYVLANAREVGIERVKMVLDGGFWSRECFTNLHDLCDAFTVGMPIYLKDAEAILFQYGDDIEKYANKLRDNHVFCVPVTTEIHGVPGRILLYYDSWNHVILCDEMSNSINRLQSDLAALKRYPKSTLGRYTSYFKIEKRPNGSSSGFSYSFDYEKIDEMRHKKGYFLLFTTDMDSSPSDILDYYRAKDADEKLFAQIKVDMDGARIRTHNEQTTEGKTFVTFIACVIRAYILNKLVKYLSDNSTSLKKVFNQLSNITIVSGSNGYRFTKALTKKQKKILDVFDAAEDIVTRLNK